MMALGMGGCLPILSVMPGFILMLIAEAKGICCLISISSLGKLESVNVISPVMEIPRYH